MMSCDSRPTVVDLFSGAGFFSHAFQKEGFEIIQSVELDQAAARTYARNLGDHVTIGDVTKVIPKGRCDVIVAGPPCQGFSTMSRKRDDKDPRNLMCLEVVKWAKVLKPQIVVIENVAPFLNAPIWQTLKRKFNDLGYDFEGQTLNALDFGVPQSRQRSFSIATKTSISKIHKLRQYNVHTVRQAWEGLTSKPNGLNNHVSPPPSKLTLARIKYVPAEGDRNELIRRAPHLVPPSLLRLKSGVSDVWGRMKWDEPSNTIRTFMVHPSKGRYIHPEQHRVLSLREAARLQSVPDSFVFEGLLTQVARQIGNGVPIGLGRAVANAVYRSLK